MVCLSRGLIRWVLRYVYVEPGISFCVYVYIDMCMYVHRVKNVWCVVYDPWSVFHVLRYVTYKTKEWKLRVTIDRLYP